MPLEKKKCLNSIAASRDFHVSRNSYYFFLNAAARINDYIRTVPRRFRGTLGKKWEFLSERTFRFVGLISNPRFPEASASSARKRGFAFASYPTHARPRSNFDEVTATSRNDIPVSIVRLGFPQWNEPFFSPTPTIIDDLTQKFYHYVTSIFMVKLFATE